MVSTPQKSSTNQKNDIRQTLGLDKPSKHHKSFNKYIWFTGIIVVIAILSWKFIANGQSQTTQYMFWSNSIGHLILRQYGQ
ncbi:hypothetical protein [Shewanella saliphila]|uniref:Uncharacterized protein n=1 Tax=Shewanella saliphila TaxID=2282698 RepID=A0ABQ2Q8U2_9GAMM|nr:hypothetical protein [Shewanella saliphila]MCL1102940.1 hypothetical protein [Shewanella saliphila]GGP63461.1 hypothetical protein GCM10009409_31330 [Shewanella saliphila]